MLKIINCLFIAFLFVVSCNIKKIKEDPLDVAKSYCSCLDEELKKSRDSVIDIYDCEKKAFAESRLLRIHDDFDGYDKYTNPTIDSAKDFFLDVSNIIDTMCLNKIDPRRKKKIPHIKM